MIKFGATLRKIIILFSIFWSITIGVAMGMYLLLTILDAAKIIDLEEIGKTLSSFHLDGTISDASVREAISWDDITAWTKLTGYTTSEKPTSGEVYQSTMDQRVTTIEFNIRTANGDGKAQFTVNKALESLWRAFFNDLYTQCPDFYIIPENNGYEYRNVRGSSRLSAHAFGAAVDINPDQNAMGDIPPTKEQWERMSEDRKHYVIYQGSPMVEIGKKYSLCWGGDFSSRKDGMHFSFIGDWSRARIKEEYGVTN